MGPASKGFSRSPFNDLIKIMLTPRDKLLSLEVRKRLGKPRIYGRSMYGFSEYGLEDNFIFWTEYGASVYGRNSYANISQLTGIYQTRHSAGRQETVLMNYYSPANPRSESQQTNRGKMASAVSAWQALTTEEKQVYNQKAFGKHMSGYNVFLKEYLLSN